MAYSAIALTDEFENGVIWTVDGFKLDLWSRLSITEINKRRTEMSVLDAKYQVLTFPNLTIYDYKSIESKLTVMASKGWRIENIGAFLWKFKRAEPSNKKFFVVFSDIPSGGKISPTEENQSLGEICIRNGWEREYQWKQMQIFCADQQAILLENDEVIRLENIHQNMKKTFISNWTKVLLLMIIIAFSNGIRYLGSSLYINEKAFWAFLIGIQGAFVAGSSLLGYMLWFKISRKRISEGSTCVSAEWHRRILIVMIIGVLVTAILSFIDMKIQFDKWLTFYIIIGIMAVLAVVSLITLLIQLFK